MKIGLFQNPRTPGVFYAQTAQGNSLSYQTHTGRTRLAEMFGYAGPGTEQDVLEWLGEKATVILPPKAELEIEDPGLFAAGNKIYL